MTFIITLISLLIERFFDWSQLRNWRWFTQYEEALSKRLSNWSSYLVFVLAVLPPVILVAILYYFSHGWLYGIFKLIFGVLVLTYCLGPENLWAQMYACIRDMNNSDPNAALIRAQNTFGIASPNNSQAFHHAFVRAIFIAAHHRIFSVIFWFIFLGPAGALLYRMVATLSTQSTYGVQHIAQKTQSVLEWLPARFFGLLFALGGHFTQVFNCWKKHANAGLESNDVLISECGVAALDVVKDNQIPEDGAAEKESIALLDRVLIIVLVLLAIVVILV